MSNKNYEISTPIAIYRLSYVLQVADDKNLLPRAAQKAKEVNVCGYMMYTHSGHAVSGELEGTRDDLQQMLYWLQLEGGEKPRLGRYQQQLKAKYDDFFCC
ncbi:uncharacterized protein LOC132797769 [Drosophila nasuta]|uniref:Uncharacterized protein LOC117564093 n=1 Tax=Drosophila albomicans TaxID=7291 RepID=A0A6P8WL87_DROAB|nr:uncharacterized protein LOC117564093 [Drosophila albomicans]XP_060665534.1 uncharacterized protein LOC132797769 [Drosophila nasuta]